MTANPLPQISSHIATALLGEGAESAQLGIAIYDDTGMYVAVNQYVCDVLGYKREELMQYDVGDFMTSGLDRALLRVPERREGVRLVTRKDGSTVALFFVVVATRIAGDPFYIAFWWDLAPDDPRAIDAV